MFKRLWDLLQPLINEGTTSQVSTRMEWLDLHVSSLEGGGSPVKGRGAV